jgi:hypothetical protein
MFKRLNFYKKVKDSRPKPISQESREFAERYANMTLEEMDKYFDEEYQKFCDNNPLNF